MFVILIMIILSGKMLLKMGFNDHIRGYFRIIHKYYLDYVVISKTKLDSSFPLAQCHSNNYEVRARRDRNKNGDGLIESVKKGFI